MIMSATIHTRTNPVLIDGVIAEIQTQMAQRVEWLNNIFGRVERLVKNVNGRTIYSANQYKSGNEYTLIAPDSGLGNFAFFVVDEPETMDYYRGDRTHFSTPFSLVVWVDMRTIASGENRNTEAVKQEIVRFLNDELRLRSGRMYVNRIFNRAESIFKGFTLDEIDNQFLMQPFCGWRFEGEIEFYDTCAPYVPPTPPVEPQYIRGHITDDASTFTFIVNNNQNITVDVDVNGNWKWNVDRSITSLYHAFLSKPNLESIEISGLNELTNLNSVCGDSGTITTPTTALKSFVFKDCDLSNVVYMSRTFQGCTSLEIFDFNETLHPHGNELAGTFYNTKLQSIKPSFFRKIERLNDAFGVTLMTKVDMSEAESIVYMRNTFANGILYEITLPKIVVGFEFSGNPFGNRIETINALKEIKANIPLNALSLLKKQSIINIINAAAANVTYTLHSTVYAKCASGGEWHTDIQAAIDAKAAQGFTVTLISA